MDYNFELKSKGYLKIEGHLSEFDSKELERILLLSLEKCHDLELNIDDIASISSPCEEILGQAGGLARQKKKSIILSTRFQRDAMSQWLKDIPSRQQVQDKINKI